MRMLDLPRPPIFRHQTVARQHPLIFALYTDHPVQASAKGMIVARLYLEVADLEANCPLGRGGQAGEPLSNQNRAFILAQIDENEGDNVRCVVCRPQSKRLEKKKNENGRRNEVRKTLIGVNS